MPFEDGIAPSSAGKQVVVPSEVPAKKMVLIAGTDDGPAFGDSLLLPLPLTVSILATFRANHSVKQSKGIRPALGQVVMERGTADDAVGGHAFGIGKAE